MALLQVADQFGAVHAGHDHVREQQIDAAVAIVGDPQGVLRRIGREHVVAEGFQDAPRGAENGFFVFDQQDGFVAAGGRPVGFGGGRLGIHFRAGVPGQIDVEGGALARRAGHVDAAAVLLDDAVDGGESEAGALADGLGGEEGLEDVFDHVGLHAAAVVADGQQRVRARFAACRFAGDGQGRVLG